MGEEVVAKSRVSVLSDAPAKHDLLDYEVYRDSLISIMNNPATETPLTIGVFGDWGSGKTTLLNMVDEELKELHAKSVWVNVWQFEKQEDIWAAFLQALLLKIKTGMPWYRRLLFNVGLLRQRTDWQRLARKIPELLVRIAIVIVPLYFFSSGLVSSDQPLQSSSEVAAKGAGTIASAILGWYLVLQPYVKAVRERVKVDLTGMIAASPLSERVSVLEQFKSYFEHMITSFAGEKGRVIIFVDDLDRCSPEHVAEILDAIKLFLEIPRCVYVLGLDREVIEQAVTIKFAEFEESAAQARAYLDKIIGLPFYLPVLSTQQMETFVTELGVNLPDAERTTQVFALGQTPNPRKVKRALNMYLFMWALSQRRERLEDAIKPVRLAKIVVIQHSYRDLYERLMLFPQHLGELEAHFRKDTKDPSKPEVLPTDGGDRGEKTSLEYPGYLKPFVDNGNLRRLLTLHPGFGIQSQEANFTEWNNGDYEPIPEEDIRSYIELTYSVALDRRQTRKTKSRSVDEPTFNPQSFINREREQRSFRQLLEQDTPDASVLLITSPAGTGKTALLKQFEYDCTYKQNSLIPASYLEGSKFEDIIAFMKEIRSEFIMVPHGSFAAYDLVHRAWANRENPGRYESPPPEGILNPASRVNIAGGIVGIPGELRDPANIHVEPLSEEEERRWRPILIRAFMTDLTNLAAEHTVVLLIDGWERMHASVQEWIMSRFLTVEARRALPRLVIVISGRIVPEVTSAHRISPLKPFTPVEVATLIRSRYEVELPEDDIRTLSEVARGDIAKALRLVQQYLDLEQSK